MNYPFCSGEDAAHQAGEEGPSCFFCDECISDLDTLTFTTRGSPVCHTCRQELNAYHEARKANDLRALMEITDLRPDFLRPNFHD